MTARNVLVAGLGILGSALFHGVKSSQTNNGAFGHEIRRRKKLGGKIKKTCIRETYSRILTVGLVGRPAKTTNLT